MPNNSTNAPIRDVLITAGATRNPIDSMRYLSAHSSGKTGTNLAEGLLSQGAKVHMMASPEAAQRVPPAATMETFGSTRDLLTRMEAWLKQHPGALVVHAAAVGDYEVAPQPGKIPSGQTVLQLELRPTPKILDRIRSWNSRCFLVSFKAAPPETSPKSLEKITSAQLRRSQSDLVFGNVIDSLNEQVILTDPQRNQHFPNRKAGLQALLNACIQALTK